MKKIIIIKVNQEKMLEYVTKVMSMVEQEEFLLHQQMCMLRSIR